MKEQSFEEKLEHSKALLEKLMNPEITLEESVKLYEEGLKNIKEAQVKRAVELSTEKYCSASLMLSKTAEITHEYEIINVD